MKICSYCKNEFEPKKPKAIYCSTKCRTYAHRDKKKDENPYKMYADGLHPAVKQIKDFVETELKKEKKGVEPKEGSLAWYLKHGNEQK